MKSSRNILAAAAALMMLCGMTACGSQTAPQQSAAEQVQTEVPASATEAPEESAEASEEKAAEEPAAESAEPFDPEKLPQIALTSENLHDGVWDDEISNTDKGSNHSPQLQWETVEGAACYAVYMVDTTVTFWLHWKSANVTETALPAGWASAEEYVGPYPPSGTHDYEIRVYALKESVTEDKSKFDSSNYGFDDMVKALDGDGGNVLAYGTLNGTFTR